MDLSISHLWTPKTRLALLDQSSDQWENPLASPVTHDPSFEIPGIRACSLLRGEGYLDTKWQGGSVCLSWALPGLQSSLVKGKLLDWGRRKRMSGESGFAMNRHMLLNVQLSITTKPVLFYQINLTHWNRISNWTTCGSWLSFFLTHL